MAIPGIRGLDHVGFTVPDLEQAHEFFVDVLGCEFFFELGPFESKGGTWLSEHVNVDDRARFRNRHYRLGNGSNFEIFEYELDGRNEQQPLNSDVGGFHLAFYVDDLDEAVDYLKSLDSRAVSNEYAEATASGALTMKVSSPTTTPPMVRCLAVIRRGREIRYVPMMIAIQIAATAIRAKAIVRIQPVCRALPAASTGSRKTMTPSTTAAATIKVSSSTPSR